jgi:hypothetical protein
MLLAFFGHRLSHLLGWLEPHYLRWTQLPRCPGRKSHPSSLTQA